MAEEVEKMQENMSNDSTGFIENNFNANFVNIQTLKENYENKIEIDSANSEIKLDSISINTKANNLENKELENNTKADNLEKNPEKEQKKYEIKTQITSINAENFPDSVIINAIVYDSEGNFISGLASPYLAENQNYKDYWKFVTDSCKGIATKIEDLQVEEIRESTSPPFSICFVLDNSTSMGELRAVNLQQSVRYVTGKIKAGDYISATKFTSKSTTEVLPTNNKDEFISKFRINGMSSSIYGNGTDILLALDSAAETLLKVPEKYKRIIILFSDGMGGNSNYQNVIKKLRNNDIRVFPICYGMTDISFMEKLAKDTDGKMFWLSNIKDFSKVFEYIYNLLNNHYKITYKPLNCNDLHNVTLNLDVKEFGFEKIQSFGEYDKSIFTDFAEVGTMTFIDIEFEYNKAEINQESVELLGDLVNQLKRNEQIKIEICGHTDDIGGEDYNMQLSLARANSVKNELVKLGINSARLSVKGFGKTKPIVPNDSEENRKKNRRTEFIIID